MKHAYLFVILLLINSNIVKSQSNINKLKFTGNLLTDQRFLLKSPNDWAWNENRLTMKFEKKIAENSKFYSEIWLRNIGLPNISTSADLYNKNIIDHTIWK